MPVSPLKILTVAAFAAAGSSGQWSVVGGQFAPPAVAGAAFAAAAETKTEVYAHPVSRHYKPPREPEVRAHLERWRDLKFGVLISWGIYNELDNGIGSWVICAEKNQPWISRPKNIPYEQYKRDYWLLKDKFAPTKFDPEKWAEVFKDAGVKYMIFTTKHHDGFAMWDTKQTDFSIAHGAFKNDPRRDLAKGIFSTFQKHKFVTGVYFSKPDWHSPYFWKPDAPTPNRNVNYSIPKEPERWQKFKDYTYAQIEELTGGNYGKIDILWLDGGWVRPRVQDINIAHVAKIARSHNPEMIVVDRAVPSEFENYQTPEGHVLKGPQSSPWETCTTLGRGWEHVNNPKNNSAHWLVHTLVDIVAKNGNLLLGLGPDKYGELDPTAVATLRKTGAWLRANGEAIYGTRAARHYKDGSVWFTQAKNAANVYAIACFPEGKPLPKTVRWKHYAPTAGAELICLQTGKPAAWKRIDDAVIEVTLPADLPADTPAAAFRIAQPRKGDVSPPAVSPALRDPDNSSTRVVGTEFQPNLRASDPAQWRRVAFTVNVPTSGVTVAEGTFFHDAMRRNIRYLVEKFSVAHILYPFRVRHGDIDPSDKTVAGARQIPGWDTDLRGANAGRFLMGAGNTLRWLKHEKLAAMLDEVIAGITACREPDGYILPWKNAVITDALYEENVSLDLAGKKFPYPAPHPTTEEPNYARAWLTHGLLDAGVLRPQTLSLLRGHADWFNSWNSMHPRLLHWGGNNHQGHIASTRTFLSSIGKPLDLQIAEKFYVCDWWLDALRARNPAALWRYPLQNPHSYLITSLEAYFDHYTATGDERFLDAARGGWEMINSLWEHVGGSIALCENHWKYNTKQKKWTLTNPPEGHAPRAYDLSKRGHSGETCGSVFWLKLNQRFHQLFPNEERYVAEIEKSLYNVVFANQQGDGKNRYHAVMEGRKDRWGSAQNSCCEGQAARAIGSVPEFIFSTDATGVWLNLFESASFEGKIGAAGGAGEVIRLQTQSDFPRGGDVKVLVKNDGKFVLHIRVPSWSTAPAMTVFVNGIAAGSGKRGTYLALEREWRAGDTVSFTLPLGLRQTRYSGVSAKPGKERYALEYGPLLLACSDGAKVPAVIALGDAKTLVEKVTPRPDEKFIFRVTGGAGATTGNADSKETTGATAIFKPYFLVGNERFTTFPIVE